MIVMEITRTCSLDGCDRAHKGKGYCRAHLDRLNRTGDPGPAALRVYAVPSCTIDGCDDVHVAQGLCDRHYARLRKHGDPLHFVPRIGEHAPNWQGDAVDYEAAHRRVRVTRGRAPEHTCPCGQQADEWAYDHQDENVKYAVRYGYTVPFSTDPAHYIAMCRPHHRALDAANKRTASA